MKIEIPTKCPICDSTLILVNDQLFCKNIKCTAKSLKSIIHYAKAVKIMGLGEKTVEKLGISNIYDLYNLSNDDIIGKLGEKLGDKLFEQIRDSTNTTLSRFLSGMGIPLIGKTASEKISTVVSKIEDINEEACKKAGLGAKATENLVSWVENEYKNLYVELPINFKESEPITSGMAVCISGKIPGYTKSKLKEYLLDYNVIVKDNVTKDISYLITEETNTSKVKKAEQYNINVISFDNFMEIINE